MTLISFKEKSTVKRTSTIATLLAASLFLLAPQWANANSEDTGSGDDGNASLTTEAECVRYAPRVVPDASFTAFITGIIRPGTNPTESTDPLVFIDLTKDVILGGNPLGVPLAPGEHVFVDGDHAVRVRIWGAYDGRLYNYTALFGGEPGASRTFAMHVEASPPRIVFQEGWVFMSGDWPLTEARLVSPISDGTKFILLSEGASAASAKERVYLLSRNSKVNVKRKGTSYTKLMETKDHYCETTAGSNNIDCYAIPLPTPSDDHENYRRIIKWAQAAEMP